MCPARGLLLFVTSLAARVRGRSRARRAPFLYSPVSRARARARSTSLSRGQVALPFYLAASGIVCSVLGCQLVKTDEEGAGWNSNLGALLWALEKGMFGAGGLFVGLATVWCAALFGGAGPGLSLIHI